MSKYSRLTNMRVLVFLLGSFAYAGIANAQAFGVEVGAPVSRYAGQLSSSGDPNIFRIKVPEPNSAFESYVAVATPETGICKVRGIGKDNPNDDYGTRVRQVFSGLKAALNNRYGRNKSFDFLKVGASWDGPHEWVWSIFKEERVFTSFWDHEEGSSLPAGVQSIELDVKSVKPSNGAYVTLSYEFDNFGRCLAIVKRTNNQGL